jgi:hypothetical protein
VAKAYAKNYRITHINLQKNEIGDLGVSSFMNALKQHRTNYLKSLNLSNNLISQEMAEKISNAVASKPQPFPYINLENNLTKVKSSDLLGYFVDKDRASPTVQKFKAHNRMKKLKFNLSLMKKEKLLKSMDKKRFEAEQDNIFKTKRKLAKLERELVTVRRISREVTERARRENKDGMEKRQEIDAHRQNLEVEEVEVEAKIDVVRRYYAHELEMTSMQIQKVKEANESIRQDIYEYKSRIEKEREIHQMEVDTLMNQLEYLKHRKKGSDIVGPKSPERVLSPKAKSRDNKLKKSKLN